MDVLQRRLVVAVAALAALTVAGLVALWPPAIDVPAAPSPGRPLSGEIVALEYYEGEGLPELGISGASAVIDIRIVGGDDDGSVVQVDTELDGYPDLDVGDRVRLVEVQGIDGLEYGIVDFERGSALLWLVLVFVGVVLLVGGWHGARSLVGLVLSLGVVVGFVVPAILAGESPFAVAFFGALAVMLVTLPLAHGLNPMTSAAIVGTAFALGVTVVLGLVFIDATHLTGFSSEEANMARFAIPGLDPKGLVLAGLIIAALGVLDDVTVSQASTVFALRSANPRLGWSSLFGRAMSVGRDHIASTVNTLVLAYAGASLALLVLFSTSGVAAAELIGSEVIAEEIVKTLVGSIGLISAVPLTTALAASLALRTDPGAFEAMGHGHHHGPSTPVEPAVAAVPGGTDPDDGAPVVDEETDYKAWIDELKYGSGPRPPESRPWSDEGEG